MSKDNVLFVLGRMALGAFSLTFIISFVYLFSTLVFGLFSLVFGLFLLGCLAFVCFVAGTLVYDVIEVVRGLL